MTNTTAVFVLAVLAASTGLAVITSFVNKRIQKTGKTFQILGLLVLGWLSCEIIFYSMGSEFMIRYMLDLKLPFVAFTMVCLLLLCMKFYNLDRYVTKKFVLALCVIPAITTVLCITSPWHSLIRLYADVVQVEPLHVIDNVRGPWFWVHAIYSYGLTVASAVVLTQHRKLPSGYRAPSMIMIVAMVVNFAANVMTIATDSPIDYTTVGMALAVIIIYAAITNESQGELLEIAREEVFNSLGEYIFIQDLNGQVMDVNNPGRRWLLKLGLPLRFPMAFAEVFGVLRHMGATIRESAEEGGGTDIYYSQDDRGVMFNLQERFIEDKEGVPIGVCSTLLDVTRYKTLIERLEETVDIDALTGVASRRAFEEQKRRYDEAGTAPLSVVLGDANGLKRVNDELGHAQGDVLLRVLAAEMRQSCPPSGIVARIGGDEFVLLLPGAGMEQARAVCEDVTRGLAEKTGYPFKPSIALGVAQRRTTEDGAEKMDELVRRADLDMYSDKANDRRGSRRGPEARA